MSACNTLKVRFLLYLYALVETRKVKVFKLSPIYEVFFPLNICLEGQIDLYYNTNRMVVSLIILGVQHDIVVPFLPK